MIRALSFSARRRVQADFRFASHELNAEPVTLAALVVASDDGTAPEMVTNEDDDDDEEDELEVADG